MNKQCATPYRLAALLTVMVACAPAHHHSTQRSPTDDVEWSAFQWVSASIAGTTIERAGLLFPITIDTLGGTFWLQLDTGADSDVWLYTAPLDQLLARRGSARDTTTWFEIPSGRVGAYPLSNHPVNIRAVVGDTVRADALHPKIGTLGLNFFRERVLLLDFPRERFAILDSAAALPHWIATQATWVPIDYRDDKAFLPLTLGDTVIHDFFYDSGASLFPVSTTNEIWRLATGRTGDEPDNTVWTVSSFGQKVTLVGAPARGNVQLGSAELANPLTWFLAEGPDGLRPENWGFRASGLIGNQLFVDSHLIVVDLPRRRFGMVKRAAAP